MRALNPRVPAANHPPGEGRGPRTSPAEPNRLLGCRRAKASYTYGAPGAGFNTAGRITRVTSQMGVEERQYGKLGETLYEKKTVTTSTGPTPRVYETRYLFETFGRLLRITYPDLEVVTNVYDSGGNLQSASGVKAVAASGQNHRYHYLQKLHYDKFEQRAFVEQGNGVKTAYSYNAQTRRLSNLNAVRQGNTIFQNLSYSYDKVGNILGLKNDVALPHANEYGGPSLQRFEYDDLYRLTKAQGVFPANVSAPTVDKNACAGVPTSHCRVYDLGLGYDSIHNILAKNQRDTRYPPGNTQGVVQKKNDYDFTYAYAPSGPTSVRPHAPTHIGDRTFTYDANGNQLGWTHDRNGTRRTIVWDDENRIQSLFDNGHEKTYKYDDQGQRLIKRGPQGETVYVNQFFTDRPGSNATKHVYAGTSRIASKLMRQDGPGSNPHGNTPFEKDLYFYHPDHLGSSSYITDLNGKLYEALIYFPFGEGWIEENTNVQRTPYHFTAKELDEETGLYYFGARYYDPRTSVWQSPDPILAKYLPGFRKGGGLVPGIAGGVLEPSNLGLYTYVRNNPLRLVDPDGKWPPAIHEDIIDRAFPGLPQEQRQILKDRSAWVDRPAGQTKAHNHEHAMRSPGEDPVTARRGIDQNIQNHEEAAQKAQGGTPESASQIKPEAMKEFGEALHPVTDRTSPAHTDAEGNPRDWRGIPSTPSEYNAARQHQREEATISPAQMNTAVGAARESFGRAFGPKALKDAITPPKQE